MRRERKVIFSSLFLVAVVWGRASVFAAVEQPKTFGDAVKLVGNAIVLVGEDKDAKVLISPGLQGRVMTSTFGGDQGPSLGWINPPMIENPDSNPHFNNYGGEDRFWMGPEGGQFSLFFRPGGPQDIEYWYTPTGFNEGPFTVSALGGTADKNLAFDGFGNAIPMGRANVTSNDNAASVTMSKQLVLQNYSKTRFAVKVARTIEIIPKAKVRKDLGIELPQGVKYVAFQSTNKVTNAGDDDWTRDKGLLSIWILCMFNPSPQTVVIAPYANDAAGGTGPLVNDRYFGKVPGERFVVKDDYMAFLTDGQYRSKIGIPPSRAKNVLGSIDFTTNHLTLARFTLPGDKQYVNSMWFPVDRKKDEEAFLAIEKNPFGGDVANSYNDGPVKPGMPPLGGFYELESSSPAYELGSGGSMKHIHQTYHFQGPLTELNKISKAVLGVDLNEVKAIFLK